MKGVIITVNYQNWELTKTFVTQMNQYVEQGCEIIVVDNSPEKEAKQRSEDDRYIYFASPMNLGYFGGAQYALARINAFEYDFVVICNNDVEIKNHDFLSTLYPYLSKYDVIAPQIRTPNGIQQNPHRSNPPSAFRKTFLHLYFLNYWFAKFLTWLITKKKVSLDLAKDPIGEQEIFSPHGAFVIFTKSYFSKGGGIDANYFLYGEEDSIAGQADKYNLKIGFVPALEVLHHESLTTGKGISRGKYKYQKQAYRYINKEYNLF